MELPEDEYKLIDTVLKNGCMETLKRIDITSYIYVCYKQWYYLGKPIVSDKEFDQYEDMFKKYYPDHPALKIVGLIYPKCKCCSTEKP